MSGAQDAYSLNGKTSDDQNFTVHRGNQSRESQVLDDRRDRHAPVTAGNRRQMGKTSDDVELNQHRGNSSGQDEFSDDRRDDR